MFKSIKQYFASRTEFSQTEIIDKMNEWENEAVTVRYKIELCLENENLFTQKDFDNLYHDYNICLGQAVNWHMSFLGGRGHATACRDRVEEIIVSRVEEILGRKIKG